MCQKCLKNALWRCSLLPHRRALTTATQRGEGSRGRGGQGRDGCGGDARCQLRGSLLAHFFVCFVVFFFGVGGRGGMGGEEHSSDVRRALPLPPSRPCHPTPQTHTHTHTRIPPPRMLLCSEREVNSAHVVCTQSLANRYPSEDCDTLDFIKLIWCGAGPFSVLHDSPPHPLWLLLLMLMPLLWGRRGC